MSRVPILCAGVNLRDRKTQRVLRERFSDVPAHVVPCGVVFTVSTAGDVVEQVLVVVDRLRRDLPGVVPLRVYPDLVTVDDVVQRTGVSGDEAVSWLSDTPTTPATWSNGETGAWRWSDVVRRFEEVWGMSLHLGLPDGETVRRIDEGIQRPMRKVLHNPIF